LSIRWYVARSKEIFSIVSRGTVQGFDPEVENKAGAAELNE
jgi:hypothetical protein